MCCQPLSTALQWTHTYLYLCKLSKKKGRHMKSRPKWLCDHATWLEQIQEAHRGVWLKTIPGQTENAWSWLKFDSKVKVISVHMSEVLIWSFKIIMRSVFIYFGFFVCVVFFYECLTSQPFTDARAHTHDSSANDRQAMYGEESTWCNLTITKLYSANQDTRIHTQTDRCVDS